MAIERAGGAKFEDVRELVAGTRGAGVLDKGDMDAGIWSAGQTQGLIHDIPTCKGLIHDIPTCKDLVDRIMRDAEAIIRNRLDKMVALDRLQMIDRAVSRAETRRGADGSLHEIVAALDGVAERQALSQAAGDGGRQRAAGAVGVLRADALGDVGARARRPGVNKRSVTVSLPPCPPLSSTAFGPSESSIAPARSRSSPDCSAKPQSRSASGRLGVISAARGKRSAFRTSIVPSSASAAPLVATITGSTTSGMPRRCFRQRRGDGQRDLGRAQHADLDRVGADIGKTALDLLAHDIGRNEMDGADAGGVLRGDGGDRRHGVGAERRRRLDVGLDAGAAARVRSRDDEQPSWLQAEGAVTPRPPGSR